MRAMVAILLGVWGCSAPESRAPEAGPPPAPIPRDAASSPQDGAMADAGPDAWTPEPPSPDAMPSQPVDAGAPPPDAAPDPCAPVEVARAPLLRLNARQFNASVEALGLPGVEIELPETAGPILPLLTAEKLAQAAREIAEATDLGPGGWLPCDPLVMGEEPCAALFIDTFGAAALRRPPPAPDADWLAATWAALPAEGFEGRARLLIEIVLQSPQFLYRLEWGDARPELPPAIRALTHHEVAARLAYTFWDAPPDAALRAAADDGELGEAGEVEAAAARLLADPRARAKIRRFFIEWLDLDDFLAQRKDPERFPEFDPALRASMLQEVEALVDRVASSGTLRALLTTTDAWLDAPLAELYGVEAAPGWGSLDPAERAGVLTRAAVLAHLAGPAEKSPIRRGVFLRDRLLCQPLPPPPPDVAGEPVERGPAQGAQTIRALTEARTAGESCQGCHRAINAAGFTLERYDALGRYVTEERGVDRFGEPFALPIDARGGLPGTDIPGPLEGGIALSSALAGSDQVADCFVQRWLVFALSRPITARDRCSLAALQARFRQSGGDLPDLFMATAGLDAFRYLRWEAP